MPFLEYFNLIPIQGRDYIKQANVDTTVFIEDQYL